MQRGKRPKVKPFLTNCSGSPLREPLVAIEESSLAVFSNNGEISISFRGRKKGKIQGKKRNESCSHYLLVSFFKLHILILFVACSVHSL